MTDNTVEIAVIGAGSIGIAVAYYLVKSHGVHSIALIDSRNPMSYTSAQSGENYRNWWPHPIMMDFTNHSIDLMEAIDSATSGRINMTRGGYVLATRKRLPEELISPLYRTYGHALAQVRIHETATAPYLPPTRSPWNSAPEGVDVLANQALIRKIFPSIAQDVATVIHIRRAGSISAQQLGQHMIEEIRAAGGRLVHARVQGISAAAPFKLDLAGADGRTVLLARKLVNTSGPLLRDIAQMLGEDLPVQNVFQQKISFEDREGVIPRDLPFTVDLDGQTLRWSDEDRALLAGDPTTHKFVELMPGGIHCRPEGATQGQWIKLGWAYNQQATDVHDAEPIDTQFPDTVLRGASRLHPGLQAYIGRLPRGAHHYGGYYTMTKENWPLIGKMATPGAFVAGALSGFGSMSACAAGELCAQWVTDAALPLYAAALSPDRYDNPALMQQLERPDTGAL